MHSQHLELQRTDMEYVTIRFPTSRTSSNVWTTHTHEQFTQKGIPKLL